MNKKSILYIIIIVLGSCFAALFTDEFQFFIRALVPIFFTFILTILSKIFDLVKNNVFSRTVINEQPESDEKPDFIEDFFSIWIVIMVLFGVFIVAVSILTKIKGIG